LSLALLASAAAAAAETFDGPYLVPDGRGQWLARWVDSSDPGIAARDQPIKVGQEFTVPAVGRCPAFKVRTRAPEPVAPDQVKFSARQSLFVLADTHGEYEILCEFLQKHRVVDSALRWAYGRGHLVVTGDIFDRGANQTEILWWFYQLEAEARRAGGGLHLLLGNHETMALRGDGRYLNDKYKQTATALNVRSYSELFAADTLLGQWLRTKPIVLKANSVLAMHGGLSKALLESGLSLHDINASARAALSRAADSTQEISEREKLVMGREGPQWYRGYFPDQKEFTTATRDDVDLTLKTFGVQTVVVGHTIVETVTPLYEGEVIAVQVYPHRDEQSGAGVLEGAVLTNGKWQRAKSDGALAPLS
jgi:hypothetical protein